jgi:hypothetical protein
VSDEWGTNPILYRALAHFYPENWVDAKLNDGGKRLEHLIEKLRARIKDDMNAIMRGDYNSSDANDALDEYESVLPNNNGLDIVAEEELITPEIAAKYLQDHIVTSGHNRFCEAIKNKSWLLTHQGIAFDTQGALIDGRLRLNAIIEANTAVKMLVFRGLDPSSKYGIDGGIRRDSADVYRLTGAEASIINYLYETHNGYRATGFAQGYEVLRKYVDGFGGHIADLGTKLTSGKNCSGRVRTIFGGRPAGLALLLTMIRNEASEQDTEILFALYDNIRKGLNGTPKTSKYRDSVMNRKQTADKDLFARSIFIYDKSYDQLERFVVSARMPEIVKDAQDLIDTVLQKEQSIELASQSM